MMNVLLMVFTGWHSTASSDFKASMLPRNDNFLQKVISSAEFKRWKAKLFFQCKQGDFVERILLSS